MLRARPSTVHAPSTVRTVRAPSTEAVRTVHAPSTVRARPQLAAGVASMMLEYDARLIMAGVAEASAMVAVPSKPTLQRLAPLFPVPTPTSDTHSQDVQGNTSRPKRKRRLTDDGSTTDEEGDMSKTSSYECRFCNMRFAKSQALGGHMNRHRQEREKEQYHHAQQLVSSMAQQQMPRTWNMMAAELNSSSYGSRSQLPPQISFNSMLGVPITTTSCPAIPDSSCSANYYHPSHSTNNFLEPLQWNVDGFSATRHGTMPSAGSHPNLSALDCRTGGMQLEDRLYMNNDDLVTLDGKASPKMSTGPSPDSSKDVDNQ